MEMNDVQKLTYLLGRVGLTIEKKEWYMREDGTCMFQGAIGAAKEKESITCIDGAVHGAFMARANSPNEVAQKLFEMAIAKKIWLGPYNNYYAIIEWDSTRQRFKKRNLTEEELLEKNSIL